MQGWSEMSFFILISSRLLALD